MVLTSPEQRRPFFLLEERVRGPLPRPAGETGDHEVGQVVSRIAPGEAPALDLVLVVGPEGERMRSWSANLAQARRDLHRNSPVYVTLKRKREPCVKTCVLEGRSRQRHRASGRSRPTGPAVFPARSLSAASLVALGG